MRICVLRSFLHIFKIWTLSEHINLNNIKRSLKMWTTSPVDSTPNMEESKQKEIEISTKKNKEMVKKVEKGIKRNLSMKKPAEKHERLPKTIHIRSTSEFQRRW